MHRQEIAKHLIRCLRRHHRADNLHDLVAADAEDRRTDELVRLRIDEHLDHADRLALFLRTTDISHFMRGLKKPSPRRHEPTRLRLVEPHATKRRIGVERVRGNASVCRARPTAMVGKHDLVILIARVRERTAAIHIPERPNAGHVGLQRSVYGDVALCVERHAHGVEAQRRGVRATTGRHQQVRATNSSRRGRAAHQYLHRDLMAGLPADTLHCGVGENLHALVVQQCGQSFTEIGVLA